MAAYTFISDPGHGWLEVPERDVRATGVACAVSSCSYFNPRSGMVYLEEDGDAPLFARAVGLRHADVSEVCYDDACFVRDMPAYDGTR